MTPKDLIRTRPAPLGLGTDGVLPKLYDLAIFFLVGGAFVLIAHGAQSPLTVTTVIIL